MTDAEWAQFVAGMMYAAGPRRAAEIMAADPNLRETIGGPSPATYYAEHMGRIELLDSPAPATSR